MTTTFVVVEVPKKPLEDYLMVPYKIIRGRGRMAILLAANDIEDRRIFNKSAMLTAIARSQPQ